MGPTGVGKSAVGLYLAKGLNGEIISCDSMQIYKGMDIITAKPSEKVLKTVPHHLIGVLNPEKEYNVSRYRRQSLKELNRILKKGKVPIFVGGTGLYMTALVEGIFKGKAKDERLRAKLYKEARLYGSPYLHKRLEKNDPESASRIHPNDTKRIIRALEVIAICGRPISLLQKQRKGLRDDFDVRIFCLDTDRDKLYAKIDSRVDRMFRQGLVNEVKRLAKRKLGKTASYAIGLRELKGYFNKEYSLDEAKQLIKRNSRQYAKRQLTWFRKDKSISWFRLKEGESPKAVAARILRELN